MSATRKRKTSTPATGTKPAPEEKKSSKVRSDIVDITDVAQQDALLTQRLNDGWTYLDTTPYIRGQVCMKFIKE